MSFGRLIAAASLALGFIVCAIPARAATFADGFRAKLEASERKAFDAYLAAWTFHGAALDAYWAQVDSKREARKRKKGSGIALARDDYVLSFPPKYSGPVLPAGLAKRWNEFQSSDTSREPPKPIPGVADFLESAKRYYNFVPERVPERTFKQRYAAEALSFGLTKEQVVRVYALETGGLGTADMQAGIHPITGKGKPISTALGYAQLLGANTVNELAEHGDKFAARLRAMQAKAGAGTERAAALQRKIKSLQAMINKARSIPRVWARHVAMASTATGRGLHALNIDGDIGPMLQVIKLTGLKEMAQKKGRGTLESAEIELMNLAGPATGLEMMDAPGRDAPTTNFFARAAYGRNTIVREKTASQLLAALGERMDENMKNKGAIEFAEVFDEVMSQQRAER